MADNQESTGEVSSHTITHDFDRGIKTQFPTARIKRLMQSDEDVGKVAQATPVVVAKALELFMVQVVDASASRAKDSNIKRIGIPHLYRAIMEEEKFDFLRDTMEKYEAQANEAKKPRVRNPKPKKAASEEKAASETEDPENSTDREPTESEIKPEAGSDMEVDSSTVKAEAEDTHSDSSAEPQEPQEPQEPTETSKGDDKDEVKAEVKNETSEEPEPKDSPDADAESKSNASQDSEPNSSE